MSITLYKGSRGKGKTLTMVKDAYNYYLDGYRVISNMTLAFGDFMSSENVLKLSKDSNLFDCILVLDELQLFFDSRNFAKEGNKSFGSFIQQIRKRNIHIIATTQYVNTLELRFRQHIDYICYPDHDEESNMCTCLYFDISLLEDDLTPVQLSPSSVTFDALDVYPLYNSYEMLK
jgi:hypothetical protein